MSADNWGLCPACSVPGDDEQERTLREDYEQFMTREGRYEVYYKCHCTACGFSFEFEHKEQVPVTNTPQRTPANWSDGT